MYFRFLPDDSNGCMSYLLADRPTGAAVLIDPRGADVPLLQAMLAEHSLRLQWVLRTHTHSVIEPAESAALAGLGAQTLDAAALYTHGPVPTAPPSGALPRQLRFGSESLLVLTTPGHTPHCLSFLWRDRLFCGGLLAALACPHQPRPALPDAMWDSVLRKVFTLPAETLLFSAHVVADRAVSTVYEQRRHHPWFADTSRDAFLSRFMEPLAPTPSLPSHRKDMEAPAASV